MIYVMSCVSFQAYTRILTPYNTESNSVFNDNVDDWITYIGNRLDELIPDCERVSVVFDQEQEREFECQREVETRMELF